MDTLKVRYKLYQSISHLFGLLKAPSQKRILMYHNVSRDKKTDFDHYTVSEEQFVSHVNYIQSLNLKIDYFHECFGDISFTFDDGFKDNLDIVAPLFEEMKIPWTIFVATSNLERGSLFLNKDDLRYLALYKFVEIGSHGHSHRPMAKLQKNELEKDLMFSKNILEDIVQRDVNSLSFPHGSFNNEVIKSALKIGFLNLCTSIPGDNNRTSSNLYFRDSIVQYDSISNLRNKLQGGWDWLNKLNSF